ncbi:MAG: serine/threonine-protein kinase, partial [Polyangiaceae bacterium]
MTLLVDRTGFDCNSRSAVQVGGVVGESYRILGLLGSGGMGEVYEAEHLRLQAKVAVKVLRAPADEHSVQQLLREARLTASLNSDHVVRVYDCGTLKDRSPYVVMERLRGEDLRCLLAREGPLPVQRALRILLQICAGLADLHAAKVVHRDLKPANVFVLDANFSECRCKLLDLGIARTGNGDTSRSIAIAGSVRYMAPEQLAERKRVAPQTDIYAAGIILYQCLTGTLPHQGDTVEEIMFSILHTHPRPAFALRPEVSAALSRLTMRAFARDPSARPESALEFSRAISAFLVPEVVAVGSPGPLDATEHELTSRRLVGFGLLSSKPNGASTPQTARRSLRVFISTVVALCLSMLLVWVIVRQHAAPSISTGHHAPVAFPPSTSVAGGAVPVSAPTDGGTPPATVVAAPVRVTPPVAGPNAQRIADTSRARNHNRAAPRTPS